VLAICVVSPAFTRSGPGRRAREVSITVVYDEWSGFGGADDSGFAAVFEQGDQTLLFDTGWSGEHLLSNLAEVGVDPLDIDVIVLSHAHEDHTGGLETILDLGVKPIVYFVPSIDPYVKSYYAQMTEVRDVRPGDEVAPGIFSTGELEAIFPEQSLVVACEDGAVVVTGCAHPGLVPIVTQAKAVLSEAYPGQEIPLDLLMGGFHLVNNTTRQVESLVGELQDLGVQRMMPCHCTGDDNKVMIHGMLGEACLTGGVGATTEVRVLKRDT